jgi:citrate synthase
MLDATEIDQHLASALRISPDVLRRGQGYLDTPGWDSFGHVEIIMTLEELLGIVIDENQARLLHNRDTIRDFILANGKGAMPPTPQSVVLSRPAVAEPLIARGLAGVVFATTSICEIQGEVGRLSYRGIDIETLAERASFDDVCALLIDGALPDTVACPRFAAELKERAALSDRSRQRAASLVGMDPTHALAALISILGAEVDLVEGMSEDQFTREVGLTLLAQLPLALAIVLNPDTGASNLSFDSEGLVATLLRQLRLLEGDRGSDIVRYVELIFLLQAEHSSNASAFAARVATGTCAVPGMALSAAIATFSGSIHGGAIQHVVHLVEEIGTPGRAEQVLRDRRERGEPIYGFGHRVYRVTDPRARIMERAIQELISRGYDPQPYLVIQEMCRVMSDFAKKGIAPNVDLYAGTIYRMLSIPNELLLPLFCFARLPGWVAHIREQQRNNVLIRPEMIYVSESSLSSSTQKEL